MKPIFLFIFLFNLFEAQGMALSRVCSVTLNSSNEINLFKKYFPKDQFEFVELTGFESESGDWLKGACDAQIQCDVLVMSGHYAGTFYGNRGFEVSLESLKKKSCEKTCSGIFRQPQEVFLFGCNTLSTQGAELTNADLYFDNLISNGVDNQDQSFKNSMRAIFSGVPRIYGFQGKAPLGQDIEPALKAYFEKRRSKDFLQNQDMIPFIQRITGNFVSTQGYDLQVNPMCYLSSKDDILSKLKWAREALLKTASFDSTTEIKVFLYRLQQGSALQDLQKDQRLENELLNVLERAPSGLNSMRLNILEILLLLKKINLNDYEKYLQENLFDKSQVGFSYKKAQAICTSKAANILFLQLKHLNPHWFDNLNFITAMGCLKPQDPALIVRLLEGLGSEDKQVANATFFALQNFDLSIPQIRQGLMNLKNSSYSMEARHYAERLLNQ